ncbi:MAG: zinc-binding protein [Thermodesulfovibrio sp.]|nr:zinc-binding protein [Thermodesulfovibrio sp.]
MKILQTLLAVFCLTAFLGATSCQKKSEDRPEAGSRRLSVVTSLFPVYDFARQVARDKADIVLLLPPGTEPHSFDPRPADIITLNHADLFFYTNMYMEPWVRKIIAGVGSKDLLAIDTSIGIQLFGRTGDPGHDEEGHRAAAPEQRTPQKSALSQKHEHDGTDPHAWLDLANAMRMVENIRDGLIRKDPQNRAFYTENAAAYARQLAVLDEQYRTSLAKCRKKAFVNGGHFTFGYLARRYGLAYVSAYGLSPNSEPTPGAVARVTRTLRTEGLQHLFFEELLTPRIAETISRETGAELLMLHGGHNISRDEFKQGVTFLSLMEANLVNLLIGLQCG